MFRHFPLSAFGYKSLVRIRDIDAVVHNYRLYENRASETGSKCGVVMKGELHGLGMANVAAPLFNAGARIFFVEELSEGIALRSLLPQTEAIIYALAGMLSGQGPYFIAHNIIPCLNSLSQVEEWNSVCGGFKNCTAALHVDTGMNRLGLSLDEAILLAETYNEIAPNFRITLLMSHLYDIKGTDFQNSLAQLQRFQMIFPLFPSADRSLSCTDGIISLDNRQFNLDLVRPGIGLVGGAPNAHSSLSNDIKHTFELYARVSQPRTLEKGSTVGYGGKYTLTRDSLILLAHIGYKDGYLSSLSETLNFPKGAYMVMGEYRLPIIGRISLGVTILDATDLPCSYLDKYSYVEVIGPNVDIKYLAEIVGCYEILMALGRPNPKCQDYTSIEFSACYESALS